MAEVDVYYPPLDPATLMTVDSATASIADINGRILIKDSKSRLSSNASGLWTRAYAAGIWTAEPSVNINPISASAGAGQITWRTTKVLSAGVWTVTVQFSLTPTTISILALGTVSLGNNPGTVTFDYTAMEPNAT